MTASPEGRLVNCGSRGALLAVAAVAGIALSACGEQTKTVRTRLTPAQYETRQSLIGYVKAVNGIMAPLKHPPAEQTNYAIARVLSTASTQLAAVAPPPQLRTAREHILSSLRGQLAVEGKLEAAAQSHNSVALGNAQARLEALGQTLRSGLEEANQVLMACERTHYSC
jgi:hypothetical protein